MADMAAADEKAVNPDDLVVLRLNESRRTERRRLRCAEQACRRKQ